MTHRLVIGIDPGQSGAIALLADNHFAGFIDMPTMPRKTSGEEIDAAFLGRKLRDARSAHEGAYCVAVLEQVNAMPSIPGKDGTRRAMGASSAFRFGESYGVLKGVLGALNLPVVFVAPLTWKRRLRLEGTKKDFSRTAAIEWFPSATEYLQRKKDVGRADALLIAHWAELTEAVGPARAAA